MENEKAFNSAIHEYFEIDGDQALVKSGLTYAEYKSIGFLFDCLRYGKEVETEKENIKNFFFRHGLTVKENGTSWIITLTE